MILMEHFIHKMSQVMNIYSTSMYMYEIYTIIHYEHATLNFKLSSLKLVHFGFLYIETGTFDLILIVARDLTSL